jgi:DNA-binding transcriptional LysR family regulator
MDLFKAMSVFVKVAETGSLTAAAVALDISNPSVTRHLADLEGHLGARLFNRSTRRLSLTETGAAFLERSKQLLFDLEEATSAANSSTASPGGTLRINAPISFAVSHLARVLPHYSERYPKVSLDVTLSDRVVNLVEEGYDLAIRIGRIQDSSLVARKIAPVRLLLCAAAAYLERHGTPLVPSDLKQHHCLSYSYAATPDEWQFEHAGENHVVRIKGPMHANNGDLLREAALAGMGIILQPSFIVGDDIRSNKLITLLPGYTAAMTHIYAVYPSRQHLSAKVRTFVDYLVEQFGDNPYWDRDLQPS